jgi:two-component system cell cycle response regulator DivK
VSTILIVEDDEKNMKLVRDILQHHGHATLLAVDGDSGVRMAIEYVPDLILMDIHLPVIDGHDALRRIREVPALDAVPVISVSASVMPDDRRDIAGSGFDAFIAKPLELLPFLALVERFLKEGRKR